MSVVCIEVFKNTEENTGNPTEKYFFIIFFFKKFLPFNSFHATELFLYPLKTSKKLNVFRGYRNSQVIAQKMKFSIKDFSSKCDQICWKFLIWSLLLEKCLMENFIFVQPAAWNGLTWEFINFCTDYLKIIMKFLPLYISKNRQLEYNRCIFTTLSNIYDGAFCEKS